MAELYTVTTPKGREIEMDSNEVFRLIHEICSPEWIEAVYENARDYITEKASRFGIDTSPARSVYEINLELGSKDEYRHLTANEVEADWGDEFLEFGAKYDRGIYILKDIEGKEWQFELVD